MQSLLLLVAPALFAASIYIVLGRIISLVDGEQHPLIRQKGLNFLVQAGGGGIQAAGSLTLLHVGEKVIVVGLFLQLTFFGFFIVVADFWAFDFWASDSGRVVHQSPLPILILNLVHSYKQEPILPFITPPWRRGPDAYIDSDVDEARERHDSECVLNKSLNIYTDSSNIKDESTSVVAYQSTLQTWIYHLLYTIEL
ncbi:hypothetical protein C7974DRAFT_378009 [Boeremia exigua]|uniref:uncharacterized protein n=1 Tax=Boeremia exigua TaxID=749465 RepID=UPI001E8EE705|nr:uncharacterized protein C7974DRAFT_378009 [Boeremia exigua]KAH6622459.1 hypothetical protein C7974DRAFT_378009 [Boeremia exigua]